MSLLSYEELCGLQDSGVIRNSKREHVNAASIDITLGSRILSESMDGPYVIGLRERHPLPTKEFILDEHNEFIMHPGEFILAQSEQEFWLPDDVAAEYKLKSSLGRIGLEHMNAGWCDPGWHGSVLTLEFKNLTRNHSIVLRRGDPIGQVVFFRCATVPDEASYAVRGRYNNDKQTTGVKLHA